jgi:hypothetical protein
MNDTLTQENSVSLPDWCMREFPEQYKAKKDEIEECQQAIKKASARIIDARLTRATRCNIHSHRQQGPRRAGLEVRACR